MQKQNKQGLSLLVTTITTAVLGALGSIPGFAAGWGKGDTVKLQDGPLSAKVNIYDMEIDKTADGVRHSAIKGDGISYETTMVAYGNQVLMVIEQPGQPEERFLMEPSKAQAFALAIGAFYKPEQVGAQSIATARTGHGPLHLVDLKQAA